LKQEFDQNKPRVSIGLPVFNGEKYLKAALDSILAQTFIDFELIISDNASTDNTQRICQEYAGKDSRIRYFRNITNLGAPMNYNRTVMLSRGEYFKWAAADDVHAPDYLKKCIEVLDNDDSIVLCHSRTARINEQGVVVGKYDHTMRIDSLNRYERFGDLISIMINPCWTVFGVMRKKILKRTPLHGDYRGADANLLAELSLYGRLYEVPAYLFLRRDHSEAYTRKFCTDTKFKTPKSLDNQLAWWSTSSWINNTNWKNSQEFFKSVNRVPLNLFERILCYREILRWFFREGWKLFGNDVEQYFLCHSSFGRTSIKVTKNLMRHIGIHIIEEEN
jgi:glycosyltransferase involved in cell wall biosynthesis